MREQLVHSAILSGSVGMVEQVGSDRSERLQALPCMGCEARGARVCVCLGLKAVARLSNVLWGHAFEGHALKGVPAMRAGLPCMQHTRAHAHTHAHTHTQLPV